MSDVIIVGAGIVGACCAYELARAGLSITILEADIIGGGATAAGMGHIVVMDDSPAQLALTRASQLIWQEYTRQHPDQHEYTPYGTIWVARDAEEMQAVWQKHALLQQHQIPSSILDAYDLHRLEPALHPDCTGGLLVPEDSVIYPPQSAMSLLELAQQAGAIYVRETVISLKERTVLLKNGNRLSAQHILLANGLQARDLLPELPLRAKKGQLVITDRYPQALHHQLIELSYIKNAHDAHGDSVAFNVQPRPTGQLLIGSSRQWDATDRAIHQPLLNEMLAQTAHYLPEITSFRALRAWTGVRAATPDGLPLIGQHPEHPWLWLATGHEGLGITTAPITGRLLAHQILGTLSELDPTPYLPGRILQEVA